MSDIYSLRVYVAVSNDDDRMMEELGATKVGIMRNAEYSLWYYASVEPELPEVLTKWPFIWYDLDPGDDEEYYDYDDEEDPEIARENEEYAKWEMASRIYEYEPNPDYYEIKIDDDNYHED